MRVVTAHCGTTETPMTSTIEFPLAANCSLDGGPFFGFQGKPSLGETDDGEIIGETEDGEVVKWSRDEIEDIIADEMRSNEPIRVTTGDVDEDTPTIEVPRVEGYFVEMWGFDDTTQNLGWMGDDFSDQHYVGTYERKLRQHGGYIE